MMKKVVYTILLMQFVSISLTYTQINTINHEKYWYYRMRLVNEFVVPGEENVFLQKTNETNNPNIDWDKRKRIGGCGLSIPAKSILLVNNTRDLWYSDAIGVMGYYMAVLASELRLLHDYGQPYDNTQRELYFAIKAYERLELAAEKLIYGNGGELNGFFLRDDIDLNLTDNFPYLGVINGSNMLDAYTATNKYENQGNSISQGESDPNVFMTQDQLGGLVIGFSMVKKCLEGMPALTTYNGYNMVEKVQYFTYLLASRLSANDWFIRFDNGSACRYVNNMRLEGNAFGVAKAFDYILANNTAGYRSNFATDFPYAKTPGAWDAIKISACLLFLFDINCVKRAIGLHTDHYHQAGWKIKGLYSSDVTNLIVPGTGCPIGRYMMDRIINYEPHNDFSAGLTFEFATVGNSWADRDDNNITWGAFETYSRHFNVELYLLLYDFLHTGTMAYNDDLINKLAGYINSAPCDGPHKVQCDADCSNPNDKQDEGVPGWYGGNRWCGPYRAYNPDYTGYGALPSKSPGLDYMLLYNMIWLNKRFHQRIVSIGFPPEYHYPLMSISSYSYPEQYIYPLRCLNKAFFPLKIKTSEVLNIPDPYSDMLILNNQTIYQTGEYRFEAPAINIGNNFSIDGPADFVISNSVPALNPCE